MKKKYGNYKSVIVNTKSKINKLSKKGIISQEKIDSGYSFIIDNGVLTISDFLKYLSDKINIDDVDIDNEKIDNIIVKLYKEFKIWNNIYLYLKLNLSIIYNIEWLL